LQAGDSRNDDVTDFKNAFRQLKLRLGLSLVIIAILAIGIGASTAMFSLFHQILVQPLPVPEPEQLVNLGSPGPKYGANWQGSAIRDSEATFTYEMFRDLEAQQTVFTGIAAHADFAASLTTDTQTLAGRGLLVSGGYFGVLGVQPALGRLIGPDDEPRIDESDVVVLSHDFWQSHFGGDADVVGRNLTVNDRSLEIIGVAPAGFTGTALGWRSQVFVPVTLRWLMQPATARRDVGTRRTYWLYLFARLNRGMTADRAAAELNGLYSGIVRDVEAPLFTDLTVDQRERFLERRVTLEPGARGQSYIPAAVSRPLVLLLSTTGLLVMIVCANVANLLLARGIARTGEMAIRASVGASRGRLLKQLLLESSTLAVIGGSMSLPIAAATLSVAAALLPAELIAGLPVELSGTAMLFAAGAAAATVMLFGAVPAWRASAVDPGLAIKGTTAQSSGGRGVARFRSWLTTMQIAFSMVLLVLAGLFTNSLINVARVNLGFDADSLVSFSISPRLNGYTPDEVRSLYDRLENALAAEPGVTSVASASIPLVAHGAMGSQVSGPGFEWAPGVDNFAVGNAVSPGFFATVSMPLHAGREFTDTDGPDAANVAIVNESFVRKFDLGDAVGKHFGNVFMSLEDIEIVGVVADAKYHEIKYDVLPQWFMPRRQFFDVPTLYYYVRGAVDTNALTGMIPRVVAGIDRELPVSNLIAMQQQVLDNVYVDRLTALLAVAFAGLATLLAAIGLYGVLAYNVTQRTRELGLRLALGATPSRLRAMVLRQLGVMTVIGCLIGLTFSLGAGRLAESLLFDLTGQDPLVLLAAFTVVAAVALAAGYWPARRASRIVPVQALRYE
jgi:predicted permease